MGTQCSSRPSKTTRRRREADEKTIHEQDDELATLQEDYNDLQQVLRSICDERDCAYERVEHIWSLYCDFAYSEWDKLHAQIAKWKKKCGVEHYVRPKPTVHEQRLVRYALRLGSEGLDKNMLPQKYTNPDFARGAHAATHLALQKLWPDLWQHHWWQAAWIQLSVPIVTGEGEITNDPKQRAEGNGRLEEFERELGGLDGDGESVEGDVWS
jgi:hypothetical protein